MEILFYTNIDVSINVSTQQREIIFFFQGIPIA